MIMEKKGNLVVERNSKWEKLIESKRIFWICLFRGIGIVYFESFFFFVENKIKKMKGWLF